MSCSKPLPPFIFDSLYYLNREQLERFSIICRPLKTFIERYLYSKPYRVFNYLYICGGSYRLCHINFAQWHPNRDDYSVQQFLAGQHCTNNRQYYSFDEMRPYLNRTVRIRKTTIFVAGDITYNAEHIAEMESNSYLWHDGNIYIIGNRLDGRINAEHFHLVLNSPMILQCQKLKIHNAHFSFKDYNVLYAVKIIKIIFTRFAEYEIDLWQQYWQQFFEQPRVKPLVVFSYLHRQNVETLIDRFSKAFSSDVLPNAFNIVFAGNIEPLTEFQDKNYTTREKLVLKKGYPTEYKNATVEIHNSNTLEFKNYTLERSSI